jgi:hypothetical protein
MKTEKTLPNYAINISRTGLCIWFKWWHACLASSNPSIVSPKKFQRVEKVCICSIETDSAWNS